MDPLQGPFEFHENTSVATLLPAYTRLPPRPPPFPLTEHTFHIPGKNAHSRPWATLKLLSGARDPKSLPTYLEGDQITGSLDMNLDESGESHIQSVKVLLRGAIVTGNEDKLDDGSMFLDVSHILWTKDKDKRRPTTPNSSSRLSGDQHWKFSIPIPKTVTLPAYPGSSNTMTYQLPHTFLERYTRASIRYDLIVHVARGKFRVDNTLQTTFVYMPATRPPPLPSLRQIAYIENSGHLLGPEIDTEGWMTLPPFKAEVNGKQIQCSLSLALPLSYARGSPLPLHLTLFSPQSTAVDVNNAIDIRLRRLVGFRKPPIRGEINQHFTDMHSKEKGKVEDAAFGRWWGGGTSNNDTSVEDSVPQSSGPDDAGTQNFHGEIQLPRSLKPSTKITHFSVEYFVVVIPKVTPSAHSTPEVPLLEQRVEVTTMFARGPKPISFAPSA
ncbi:hypothetical protein VNI00_013276 [Paramarasmius palmivorus]|uniref:Arrestin-like N-terminal domain-containing protein n=1 Tax=Paramarasmius palmivorus TaxID=297713 RepID=A0AAW0C3G8_9AGAR